MMRLLVALPVAQACTTIAVGKGATATGSSFVTHTSDFGMEDPRVMYIPAKDYALPAYREVWISNDTYPRETTTTRSPMYGIGMEDQPPVRHTTLGHIPQVAHTYAYWEETYPLVNEHGLGMGESTTSARFSVVVPQPPYTGMRSIFYIKELMRVGMERCKTARCAIQTIGDLAVEYGFYGEDPVPTGEALTITDHNDTFVFHVSTASTNTSAVWVAQRVPDDHVAVVANSFTIQHVDCNDKQNFMCSPNLLIDARKVNGVFNHDGTFNFAQTYGTDSTKVPYIVGDISVIEPRYQSMRMWRVYSRVAPSKMMQAPAFEENWAPWLQPFSVKVDGDIRLTREDVFNLKRDHYEGTEFDMRFGVMAGPFGSPNWAEQDQPHGVDLGESPRSISHPRTQHALVAESRDSTISKAIAWFAPHQPASSVFVPFFGSIGDQTIGPYQRGSIFDFKRDNAYNAFAFVGNYMNLNYRNMSYVVIPKMQELQGEVCKVVDEAERNFEDEASFVKKLEEVRQHVVDSWWALSDYLVTAFTNGRFQKCAGLPNAYDRATAGCGDGAPVNIGFPREWFEMVGYNKDIRPQAVTPGNVININQEQLSRDTPNNAPWLSLPSNFPSVASTNNSIEVTQFDILICSLMCAFTAFVIGFTFGKRRVSKADEYRSLAGF